MIFLTAVRESIDSVFYHLAPCLALFTYCCKDDDRSLSKDVGIWSQHVGWATGLTVGRQSYMVPCKLKMSDDTSQAFGCLLSGKRKFILVVISPSILIIWVVLWCTKTVIYRDFRPVTCSSSSILGWSCQNKVRSHCCHVKISDKASMDKIAYLDWVRKTD